MRCRQRFGRLFARRESITGKLSSAIRAVCRVVLIFAYKIFLECESKARIVHPRLFWGMAGVSRAKVNVCEGTTQAGEW